MVSSVPTPAPGWRRSLSAVIAVLLLLALLVEAPADAQDRQDELDEIDSQIDDAEAEIDAIDAQVEVSVEELDRILADLQVLQDQLNALNAELQAAQVELEDRERVLAATTAELQRTEDRLAQTRADLEAQRETYETRVRQSYISARPDQVMSVFAATDISDFTQASRYIEAIVERDRAGFEQIDVLRRQIEADEAELARLQSQQDTERAAAEAERNRVSGLVAEQEDLVTQVESRAEDKRTVLAGLEADRDTAEQLVADLEAESAQIEAELRAAAAAAAAAAQAQSQSSGGGTVSAPAPSGSGRFIYPVNGRISSNFGYRIHPISGASRLHAGMDIAAGTGTPIGAAGAGTVIYAGWRGGYGNCIMIDHGGGIVTLYGHQSSLASSVGQQVSQGQVIGYVGSTGYSTGPHLHWEVRVNGSPTDPRGYV